MRSPIACSFTNCVFILAAVLISMGQISYAQGANNVPDSLAIVNASDSVDIEREVIEASDIQADIFYDASDSIIFDAKRNAFFLYGNAIVKYEDKEVRAATIVYDLENSTASAFGELDSLGNLVNTPVFKDGLQEFRQQSLEYNFSSGKALIKKVVTQDGELVLHAKKAKRMPNEWIHIRNGKFTTCDAENPHYHFHITKGTVVPNDKVVTGPVYLKVRKVPLPLALPFGWFPNTEKKSHGIIIPGYGNGQDLGFFLKGLGYYVPIGETLDTRFLFDIYTGGSWSVQNMTNYNKRYKYRGNFSVSRTRRLRSFPEFPDFERATDFNIQWSHNQDSKARPGVSFRASVNAGTTSNFTNNLNSSIDDFLQAQLNSSINYSKSWAGTPFSLSVSARHSQNNNTGAINFTLPDAVLSVNRLSLPLGFLAKTSSRERELNRLVGVTNALQTQNLLSTTDTELGLNNLDVLANKFRGSARHRLGMNANFKLGFLSVTPSFNHTTYFNLKQLGLVTNDFGEQRVDTIAKPIVGRDWNAGIGATTKLYTIVNYTRAKNIKALRYLMTPSLSFNFTPFRNLDRTGYYGDDNSLITFSPYSLGVLGSPSGRSSGRVNLNINNNLELKVRDKKSDEDDATRNLAIIDNLTIRSSYDLFRDSLNLAPISMSGFTNITKSIRLNVNSTFDPYARDEEGTSINNFLVAEGNGLARFVSGGASLSARISSKQRTGKKKEVELTEEEEQYLDANRDEFIDFSVPWNMQLNYTVNARNTFSQESQRDTLSLSTHAIDLRGDLSIGQKWKLGVVTGFDLQSNEFRTTELSINRDLHCWEASASIVPFGEQKRWGFQINIKSSLLRDLKLQQRGNFGSRKLF